MVFLLLNGLNLISFAKALQPAVTRLNLQYLCQTFLDEQKINETKRGLLKMVQ